MTGGGGGGCGGGGGGGGGGRGVGREPGGGGGGGRVLGAGRARWGREDGRERPQTYHEASGGNIVDQIDRYRELADHDLMARSIATLKARGTYEPNEHVSDEKFPPLTIAEYLELLALGERIARYYRHPSQVDRAVRAGATWDQIAAATGTPPEAARAAYREWAKGQHKLHAGMSSAWTTRSTPPRSRRPTPGHRAARHDRPGALERG